MPNSSKPIRYRGGIIRPNAQGTFRAEVNFSYKRFRKTWRSLDQAKAWINKIRIQLDAESTPLDLHAEHDARQAFEILPEGITLLEAARYWTQNNATAPRASIPLDTAIESFIEEKRAAGLRRRSIDTLQERLGPFQRDHPGLHVHEATSDVLLAWLNTRGFHGTTRKNYRGAFQNFFNWCKRAGHINRNPTDTITVPRTDDVLPGILTPEQARALLQTAETREPELCPYFAIGLFAGLRTQELKGLQWAAISANGSTSGNAPGHIHVGPDIAKTRQQRYVDIPPNLRVWVDAYAQPTGPVTPIGIAKRFRRTYHAAGIQPWPSNALRHSFATYHLALHQDAARTALQLGHTSTAILFTNYRNLATQDQAKTYFSLVPQP